MKLTSNIMPYIVIVLIFMFGMICYSRKSSVVEGLCTSDNGKDIENYHFTIEFEYDGKISQNAGKFLEVNIGKDWYWSGWDRNSSQQQIMNKEITNRSGLQHEKDFGNKFLMTRSCSGIVKAWVNGRLIHEINTNDRSISSTKYESVKQITPKSTNSIIIKEETIKNTLNNQVKLPECKYGEWGDCDEPCGGGTKKKILNTINCDRGNKQEILSEECNTHKCVYKVSDWSSCEPECGSDSIKRRRVNCTDGNNEIDDINCTDTKPVSQEKCSDNFCNFKAGNWSECNKKCGGGTRTRDVKCIDNNNKSIELKNCNIAEKPDDSQSCNLNPCQVVSDPTNTPAVPAVPEVQVIEPASTNTPAPTITGTKVCSFQFEEDSKGNKYKITDKDSNTDLPSSVNEYVNGIKRTLYYNKVIDQNNNNRVPPLEVPTKCSNYDADIKSKGHKIISESEADRLATNAGIRESKNQIKSYLEELRVGPERIAIGNARNRWSSETDMFAGLNLDTVEKCYKRDNTGIFKLQNSCSSDVGPIAANEILGDSFGTGGP